MNTQNGKAALSRRLVVVDPQLNDYRCLLQTERNHLLQLTLTTTGRNALRLAPSFPDAVWLLSPHLPDMNGLDLLEMLHSLQKQLRAVVVDSHYDPQREQRALELRAIQYLCKPVELSWLKAWRGPPAAVQKPSTVHKRPNEAGIFDVVTPHTLTSLPKRRI